MGWVCYEINHVWVAIPELLNGEVISDQFVVPPNPAEVIPVPQDITHNSFKYILNQGIAPFTISHGSFQLTSGCYHKAKSIRHWGNIDCYGLNDV